MNIYMSIVSMPSLNTGEDSSDTPVGCYNEECSYENTWKMCINKYLQDHPGMKPGEYLAIFTGYLINTPRVVRFSVVQGRTFVPWE